MKSLQHYNQARFDGKGIIITGGGSGIGLATAQLFAQQGGHVLVVGRRPNLLKDAARSHEQIASMVADVSREEDATAVVKYALNLWGQLDVLVNNAAMFALASLETVTSAQAISIFSNKCVRPYMAEQSCAGRLDRE
ncbi:hypothetical protein KSC_022920 [Ktedonobacter sp. SOSP1-52]|nr:SDR family NAD(P)-dependent oxidoreductase [Ktedonobacter sp. SOSP1-52]GHO63400.1 hypothetical protein KSC_022920 [Ktedonobacter sp. SOSP1-52]